MCDEHFYLPATIAVHEYNDGVGYSPVCDGCRNCDCIPYSTTIYGNCFVTVNNYHYCRTCYKKQPEHIKKIYRRDKKPLMYHKIKNNACLDCKRVVNGKKYYNPVYEKKIMCNGCSENYDVKITGSKNIHYHTKCSDCNNDLIPNYLTNDEGYIYLSSCDNDDYKNNCFLAKGKNVFYDVNNPNLMKEIDDLSINVSSHCEDDLSINVSSHCEDDLSINVSSHCEDY